jgi:hypothetical protein
MIYVNLTGDKRDKSHEKMKEVFPVLQKNRYDTPGRNAMDGKNAI